MAIIPFSNDTVESPSRHPILNPTVQSAVNNLTSVKSNTGGDLDSSEINVSKPETPIKHEIVYPEIEPEMNQAEPEDIMGLKPEMNNDDFSRSGNYTDTWSAESEPEPFVEPVPDWDTAMPKWGPAWELHVYITGIIFLLIALYSLSCMIRLHNRPNLISKGYFISLNLMIFILGATRSLYFLVDPYNTQKLFPGIFAYLLFNTSFPCLTAAFSIQLAALLQTLQIRPARRKVSNVKVLATVIPIHFILSISTDVVVGGFATAYVLILVCQVAFCLWGCVISIAYFYVFRELYKAARRRQGMVRKISQDQQTGINNNTPNKSTRRKYFEKPKLTMMIALKFTMTSAILTLSLMIVQIYAMCSVFNALSETVPEPWPWWGYQLSMRILEIALCFTMLYVSSQPLRYNVKIKKRESILQEFLFFCPCHRIFGSPLLEGTFTSEELESLEKDSSPMSTLDMRNAPMGTRHLSVQPFSYILPSTTGNRSIDRRHTFTDANMLCVHTSTPARKANSSSKVSMLINDSGFIRFRADGEEGGEPAYISTDDETSRAQSRQSHARSKRSMSPAIIIDDIDCCKSNGQVVGYDNLKHSASCPNTGSNTPAESDTPHSDRSSDVGPPSDVLSSYRAPSSIHLRDSIDRALNNNEFRLKTPDSLNISDNLSIPNTPGSQGTSNFAFVYDPELDPELDFASKTSTSQPQGHSSSANSDSLTLDYNNTENKDFMPFTNLVRNRNTSKGNRSYSPSRSPMLKAKSIDNSDTFGGSSLSLEEMSDNDYQPDTQVLSLPADNDSLKELLARRASFCRSFSGHGFL